jgi:resuscitation-promoting factor RpfB
MNLRTVLPQNHSRFSFCLVLLCCITIILLTSCIGGLPTAMVKVTIKVDGNQNVVNIASGKTIQNALDALNIKLSSLDQINPPAFTVLNADTTIEIKRVREEFSSEEKIIPFQQQTLKNESLPDKQQMIIQKGVNGKQQITYRKVFEDNVEVSKTIVKTVTLTESLPEIIMVGVQTPFTPVNISGKLLYLTGGNAWMMENSTSSRTPVATTGDLDGHVFTVSPHGDYLLFSRKTKQDSDEGAINSLWIIDLTEKGAQPVSLSIKNIIHFADWVPDKGLTIIYSTVEPRSTAPGWQANNDLHIFSFSNTGLEITKKDLINNNSGGIYGWWGTSFAISPDGAAIAYARPDSIGLVDMETGKTTQSLGVIPVQTRSDWAWVPGISWAYDHSVLYSTNHLPKAGIADEASPIFDLIALTQHDESPVLSLAPQAGMFAYPSTSPMFSANHFMLAYLQSIFTDQSETSRYRLMVIDQDGSNREELFPSEGASGLEPQQVKWSPLNSDDASAIWIGMIYQGNLWLVNPITKQTQQITGDGTISRLDWTKK